MKIAGSAQDPVWFKDAVIYELHVRAFFDANNDGIGDFQGLTQRLDYLQDLGVTCIWILPFFPSPLRDDGYDISDYLNVHPDYGTLDDFREFLEAAHERNMQVMIELVINHTSDQHPWFQRARNAPAGSAERDFYVWSDSDKKYSEVRIIFTDTEKSNWTWDPIANAYYWHRFFSHQPDLNYDNPLVLEEVTKAMRYWLDMGVDGLRLDAIPYLVERDGTNCENLPETHVLIKQIRAAMDENYANRMILAEANQWPTDVRAYFGDGDECHMAFHFPLMPRIFMALRLEDRLPVTDIIAQTPAIPDNCQWGLFLRNHDELTLEMVTDEERDYMYLAYSADPRMRVNVGIRRRLAPLMDNSRRRIELLNSLLFSFPGTPILYYGDELGMGDNIYLGDRNGVRTPMQWSADRNAGFSRATPAKLYSPVIMDAIYGYAAINIEAQQSDPSSLLNWMRNMIALRKLFQVFGRGTIEFLHPANRKVLAYLRRSETEEILCVANLSRFPQPVALDLSELDGTTPVEMLGYVEFPKITKQPYPLSLGAYEFLWFELHKSANESKTEEVTLSSTGGWKATFEGADLQTLVGRVLPEFLPKQRWFGAKSRKIARISLQDWAELPGTKSALTLLSINFEDGSSSDYFLALAKRFGSAATQLREQFSNAVVAQITSPDSDGILYDAIFDDDTCLALLNCIGGDREIPTQNGVIHGRSTSLFDGVRGGPSVNLHPNRGTAEQSNSSIIFGSQLIMKLFRRQEAGENPDCEISRFLTEQTEFRRIPPFAGWIEYAQGGRPPATLAMLQGLVANEGDGWRWTLEELDRYYESCARRPHDEGPALAKASFFDLAEKEETSQARAQLGIALDAACTLGRRTAEMHVALSAGKDNPDFVAEALGRDGIRSLAAEMEEHAAQAFAKLKESLPRFTEEATEQAAYVLSRRRQVMDRFRRLKDLDTIALRTRIHGDYHLGQVLRVKNDFVILDFEGEPAKPLAERRAKHSPLKDVAGMLRSFSYAAHVGLANYTARRPESLESLRGWGEFWEQSVAASFLRAYWQEAAKSSFLPANPAAVRALLEVYLLDKAFYELNYELENRPTWVRIPLAGILGLEI